MEALIDQITTFITLAVQSTPWGKKLNIDINSIKARISPMVQTIINRIEIQDKSQILAFIENKPLFENCILPNISQILSDGQINLNDIPQFLNIITGIYRSVNVFISNNSTISISSDDIIALIELIIRIILTIVTNNDALLTTANSILDSAIGMIGLVIKDKTYSCKLCGCFGGSKTK